LRPGESAGTSVLKTGIEERLAAARQKTSRGVQRGGDAGGTSDAKNYMPAAKDKSGNKELSGREDHTSYYVGKKKEP